MLRRLCRFYQRCCRSRAEDRCRAVLCAVQLVAPVAEKSMRALYLLTLCCLPTTGCVIGVPHHHPAAAGCGRSITGDCAQYLHDNWIGAPHGEGCSAGNCSDGDCCPGSQCARKLHPGAECQQCACDPCQACPGGGPACPLDCFARPPLPPAGPPDPGPPGRFFPVPVRPVFSPQAPAFGPVLGPPAGYP